MVTGSISGKETDYLPGCLLQIGLARNGQLRLAFYHEKFEILQNRIALNGLTIDALENLQSFFVLMLFGGESGLIQVGRFFGKVNCANFFSWYLFCHTPFGNCHLLRGDRRDLPAIGPIAAVDPVEAPLSKRHRLARWH